LIKTAALRHGGVIANYRCTAACRHCLYACSPKRAEGYIDEKTARSLCAALRNGGCRSVHIGGGEPFLDIDRLIGLAKVIADEGISLEYVETNAYWVNDNVAGVLKRLLDAGVDTLCISVDPFHAEYVPYGHPLKLAELCGRAGMGHFLWRREFVPALSRLDASKKHTRSDMERELSKDYIRDTARAYGIGYGGRAVNIEMAYSPRRPADELADGRPCRRLTSGDHFHADLYGRYIPPGCTGIALPLDEAVSELIPGRYPIFEALYESGVRGLLNHAGHKGFVPDPGGYSSACALCFYIRCWLTQNAPSPELDAEHYTAALAYYG